MEPNGGFATAAHTLAQFYSGVRGAALPAETVHAVRRHVLDTFGAALAGAGQPEPVAALAAASMVYGASGPAILWGKSERLPPAVAALVNGTAAHALELDDASGCDHSGAVVVPAVMAALPLAPSATDDDFVAAIAVGYDLGRRVLEAAGGYDAHNNAGWHSTGTCGVFGATAAVSRLIGHDAATTGHALGIAGSFASGTWAFLADGAMTKRLHPGNAAAAGILAAVLARSGLSGPAGVFDAPWGGFLNTYAREHGSAEVLTEGLGEAWRIHRSSIKPFASCRGTHAAVEAVLALRADGATPANVEAVEIGVHPTIVRMCGGKQIGTLVDAQMSLPYAVAVALIHGAADLPMFAERVRHDPAVLAEVSRVTVIEDAAAPSNVAANVSLRLANGTVRRRAIDIPIGSAARPLPDEALRAKYRSLAEPLLGPKAASSLEGAVWSLGEGVTPNTIAARLCGIPIRAARTPRKARSN
jgi:2-methylcitrate dehydratase PrpD